MKIAIISDIHDNLANLKKCLAWCKRRKVEALICCGDLTNGQTLEFLARNFLKTIYLVKGNIALFSTAEVKRYHNIVYLGEYGTVELSHRTMGVCHEPLFINKLLLEKKCDIVFYGHTHQPWLEDKNGLKLVNPGSLGGMFFKATFAVYDTVAEKLELKILELII